MKSIRCFFNIHKYKNVDGRGIAGKHVCIRCGNVIPAIQWPKPPSEKGVKNG